MLITEKLFTLLDTRYCMTRVCSSLHFLVNEVHVCRLALSLPCLEPFTPERIAALSDVATAWLLCCATAQVKLICLP